MTDPYAILGLTKGATTDEVKKAFKRLAMKYHPDRGGDEDKFKEIKAAYELVKDGPPQPKMEDLFKQSWSAFTQGGDFQDLLPTQRCERPWGR